jgi:hypothetical protein
MASSTANRQSEAPRRGLKRLPRLCIQIPLFCFPDPHKEGPPAPNQNIRPNVMYKSIAVSPSTSIFSVTRYAEFLVKIRRIAFVQSTDQVKVATRAVNSLVFLAYENRDV